jgi:nucleoside-diphosphate-sugar epimerase
MMIVFVAGATGVMGKQLVPRLVAAGHEVHGMTRSESKQASHMATSKPKSKPVKPVRKSSQSSKID